MRFTTIFLLVTGAGIGKCSLSYQSGGQLTFCRHSSFCILSAAANPLHVMVASKDASPMRLGHAAANVGGPGSSNFSDGQPKPKMRHLCKNMQKAVQGTASRLLAFIGIGGHSVAISAPVPEGSVTRIQITTSGPAPHKFGMRPAVEPYPPVRGSPMDGTPIWPHPVYLAQEDRFNGPFLHRAHRALMSLGPWEGRIVAFVLGAFLLLALSWSTLTSLY